MKKHQNTMIPYFIRDRAWPFVREKGLSVRNRAK
jgi:hypothetical protein